MDTSKLQQGRFLLSIDGGGGRRGRLSLLIIQEILQRIREQRPGTQAHHVFDLAGGTGAGGLIVIMLFRLQMDITTAIDAYNKLTSRVESAPSAGVVNTREGSRASRLGLCFEAIIKKHKERVEGPLFVRLFNFKAPIMVNGSLVSKAFTCALRQQPNNTPNNAALGDSHPHPDPDPDFFISWEKEHNNWAKITIIDAAKATCAFSKAAAVTIKDKSNARRTYDGNSFSDPHGEVLKEALSTFGTTTTVLIAIGGGENESGMVDDGENKRFDIKCNVEDGWKCEDTSGESHNAILPDMAGVIDGFVRLYLRMTPTSG